MQIPEPLCVALEAARTNQARWIQAWGHCQAEPIQRQALPQGDAASVVSLVGQLSEALLRMQSQHPTGHAVFLDDRTWVTKRPVETAQIGQAWNQENSHLRLLNLAMASSSIPYT